jgi:hypothetical protein
MMVCLTKYLRVDSVPKFGFILENFKHQDTILIIQSILHLIRYDTIRYDSIRLLFDDIPTACLDLRLSLIESRECIV